MEFRDLKRQYEFNKRNINEAIKSVLDSTQFVQGYQVKELEKELADYVGTRHCVTCANGTDALQIALMAWNIGKGDVVFVPDFTFFSCGEVVAAVGATPFFVDVDRDTYNIDTHKLHYSIEKVLKEGKAVPKAIIAVDLFGQPANYTEIIEIANQYGLYILEDAAQGFGSSIGDKRACSFGDIATTSFFPAKPLGCYGDGGAIFTNSDEWALLLRSLTVHGKGISKYDNVRVGMNSRLDTLQAAILRAKFPTFVNRELMECNELGRFYTDKLKDVVKVPVIKKGFNSSWAQYTIQLKDGRERQKVQGYLKERNIPTAVYYPKPMHKQIAFSGNGYDEAEFVVANELCERVLSLPFHPYMEKEEAEIVVEEIMKALEEQ